MQESIEIWFNPNCSKCRQAKELIEKRGLEANFFEYLKTPPDRKKLEDILSRLGTSDPHAILRQKEALYTELQLAEAPRDRLLDAMAANPSLIERPIARIGDRAVVARPPEKLLDLLES